MKLASNLRSLPLVAFGAALLLTALPAGAAYTYHESINTASLPALGSGNYSLDLSLLDGDGTLGNNSISVSNFAFGGGGTIVGSATTVIPGTSDVGVTGDLSGTVKLDNTAAFQDLSQGFSNGTSSISFDVTTTANGSITPDQFAVTLLDNTGATITTTAPDGYSLFTQPIDLALASGGGFSGSSPYSGTGSFSGVTVSGVPEPSRALLLVGAFGALIMRRRRAQA